MGEEEPLEHIDGPVRLSQSVLWQLVRDYYAALGPRAWGDAQVPYVITNTTYLARSLAAVVAGFLQDLGDERKQPEAEPIYVVELGAGSGRFAHRFLYWLRQAISVSGFPTPNVCYVLTDSSESLIDYWSTHRRLAPLIEDGLVDVARFDVGDDTTIHLRHRGMTLEPGRPRGAMVVLGSYVLDSLPTDVFAKSRNGLEECAVTLSGAAPMSGSATRPADLSVDWTRTPAPTPYYDDPGLEAALADCANHLTEGAFPFPVAAMQGLSRLFDLADRTLLLAADKGYTRWARLEGRGHPELARHGSVSLMVNFCALRSFNRARGGVALSSGRHTQRLSIEGFIAGGAEAGFPATRGAFAEVIDDEHPDDTYRLWESCRTVLGDWTVGQIMALLRSCSWDSNVALSCLPHLIDRAADAPGPQVDEMEEMVETVWELYYSIGEETDIASELGRLMLAAGRARRALVFFSRSVELHGPAAPTSFHMAVANRSLADATAAHAHAARALELDPDHGEAAALLDELDAASE